MKKKKLLVSLLAASPLLLAACASPSTAPAAPANTIDSANQTPIATTSAALAEVVKHNSATDCWMIIDGQTYNFTPYVQSGMHPGGDKILAGCGKDATEMFHTIEKHNSPRANENMQKYLVK